MNTLDIILPFCATDSTRAGLLKPFTRGAYTYASDGRVLIRVAALPGVDIHPEAPSETSLNELFAPVGESSPFAPTLEPPAIKDCNDCSGRGYTLKQIKCADCNGKGWLDCFFCGGHSIRCKACGGHDYVDMTDIPENRLPCEECETGKVEEDKFTDIGTQRFNNKFLRKIAALPGPVFFANGIVPMGADKWHIAGAARFTFAHGDGLIMPVRT